MLQLLSGLDQMSVGLGQSINKTNSARTDQKYALSV